MRLKYGPASVTTTPTNKGLWVVNDLDEILDKLPSAEFAVEIRFLLSEVNIDSTP